MILKGRSGAGEKGLGGGRVGKIEIKYPGHAQRMMRRPDDDDKKKKQQQPQSLL